MAVLVQEFTLSRPASMLVAARGARVHRFAVRGGVSRRERGA
jgi:hypothetical protein